MDNGYETRRQYGGERGGDPLDAYGKRVMRYPPSPEQPLSDRPRTDRAGRRSSVTVTDSMRGRGADDLVDDRSLPPSRDGASSRQSRFGPSERPPGASSENEGRVWLTREDAQPHGPSRIDDDRGPRDMRE
ncbi:hypothetical protein C8Q74DRAFT_1051172 [Fomes fomentarius]|nr:hypothetical protein C8Q74DRAFT_1051172 [Fomes fomentarius]